MATRTQVRVAVVQLLYAKELGNERAIDDAITFLDNEKIRHKQQEFGLFLLHGICEHESWIIQIIQVFVKEWDIERLGIIEKNILKLGIFELLNTNTQKAIVINEAIELTKTFNIEDACKLINGVLDNIAKANSDDIAKLIEEWNTKVAQSSISQSIHAQSHGEDSNQSPNTIKKSRHNTNKKRLHAKPYSKIKWHTQAKQESVLPKHHKPPFKQKTKKSSPQYDDK